MSGFNLEPLDPLVFLHCEVPPASTSADSAAASKGDEGTERDGEKAVEGGALATFDAVPYLPTPSPSSNSTHASAATPVACQDAAVDESSEQRDDPARVQNDINADDDGALSDDSLSSVDSELARSASPTPRRTVLFADDKTFVSNAKFVASTKRRILRTYGVTSWLYQNEPHYVVVVCSRRPDRCGFRVRAEKMPGETRWALQADKCVWEHNHDAESEEGALAVSSSSEEESESEADVEEESEVEIIRVAPQPIRSGKPWSAPTDSKAMQDLVNSRETIFQWQREAGRSPAAVKSQKLVDKYLLPLAKKKDHAWKAFRHYSAFCDTQNIPPLPLTPAMVALWLFDKCSKKDGYFSSYLHALEKVMGIDGLGSCWRGVPTYVRLLSQDPTSTAFNEFHDERKPGVGKFQVAGWHLLPSSAPRKPRTTKSATAAARSTTRKIEVIEIDGSSSSSSSDGEESEVESDAGDVSSPSKNLPPLGLPTPTDRFASANDAYLAYVRALIPVYGIGVTLQPTSCGDVEIKCNKYFRPPGGSSSNSCRWTAVVTEIPKTKRWRVNFDESCFDHSHGPAQQILDDPSWRPIVRNPAARKALGMRSSLVTSSAGKKSDAAVAQKATQERTERKKKRDTQREKGQAKQVVLPSKGAERALDVSPPQKKRRRHTDGIFAPGPSQPTSSLFFASPQPSTSTSPLFHGLAFRHEAPAHQPLAYPPTSASLPATRPFSATLSVHPVLPAPSSLVPLPTADVSAFLFALHPSLEPLTPHLVASGFTAVDSLASLALLDSAILNNVLDLVRTNAASATNQSATAPAPPSVIQLRLLARLLTQSGRA